MSSSRRVAITGMGMVSPLGNRFEDFMTSLYENKSSVKNYKDKEHFDCLKTKLASLLEDFDENQLPRQLRRSMSRVSLLAVNSTQKAISDADLTEEILKSPRTGTAFGSTMGGTSTLEDCFTKWIKNNSFSEMMTSTFLRIMPHTCAANIALAFGITGRTMATCTACSSSLQAIGFAYEAIKSGQVDTMVCGGAEEFHVSIIGVFDVMYATSSHFNDNPSETPKPFDTNRDGIVVGEASGTVILEDWDHAVKRKAKIYGEVVGFHTNTDAGHMTNPSVVGMAAVMSAAVADAKINLSDISYVNAHGTGTLIGDIAESQAIYSLFGDKVPVSSLKGNMGHLMGACGVMETIACLGMLADNKVMPTKNLKNPDPKCGNLNYIMNVTQPLEQKYILKNSFAFGGINASLVLKKV